MEIQEKLYTNITIICKPIHDYEWTNVSSVIRSEIDTIHYIIFTYINSINSHG